MNTLPCFLIFLVIGCLLFGCGPMEKSEVVFIEDDSREIPFDTHWFFYRDSLAGAEQVDFDDSQWQEIDLPHDWSIKDLPEKPEKRQIGPFSEESPGGSSTGHVLGGIGWYRKHFRVKGDTDKIITIHFDGAYMNSDVWINGDHLGNHPYGYTPFVYDLTPHINPPGVDNVIAVEVKNEGENSRWYSGSGIYRHVRLTVTDRVHVDNRGVAITTPKVSEKQAEVRIKTTVRNRTDTEKPITVRIRITDDENRICGKAQTTSRIEPDSCSDIAQFIEVEAPKLWSPDSPRLYLAIIELQIDDKIVDLVSAPFGIRSIRYDVDEGFILNGKPVLLRGGCVHHDNGPLGSAAIDRAEERRIELLKSFGFNAIRTSHNPPSVKFLDACDRLGMLVIDEAFDMWEHAKRPQDYHLFFKEHWRRDLESMILRDRNHPSVIMWSIGNEINERADPSGLALTAEMVEMLHQLEPTRPVIEAICEFWDFPGRPWEDTAPAFALLDVGGYNYQWQRYESDHKKYPDRLIVGTESVAMQAYENWRQVEKHPWVLGDFVWTSFDYFGEAGIGNSILVGDSTDVGFLRDWPWFNAYCGDIDVCGFKKAQSYFRDVVWNQSQLEMAVHAPIPAGFEERVSFWGWPDEQQSWNWSGHEGETLKVTVYSRCKKVSLELDGRKIDEKEITAQDGLKATFDLVYQPGTLKAIGLEDGREVASKSFTTTGKPVKIDLKADRQNIRADRNDLAYITVTVLDEQDRFVPDAQIPIRFTIGGHGELAAVGNGNPSDMKSFQTPECKTFHGRCLVILRPTGKAGGIRLKAEADELTPASLTIAAR